MRRLSLLPPMPQNAVDFPMEKGNDAIKEEGDTEEGIMEEEDDGSLPTPPPFPRCQEVMTGVPWAQESDLNDILKQIDQLSNDLNQEIINSFED